RGFTPTNSRLQTAEAMMIDDACIVVCAKWTVLGEIASTWTPVRISTPRWKHASRTAFTSSRGATDRSSGIKRALMTDAVTRGSNFWTSLADNSSTLKPARRCHSYRRRNVAADSSEDARERKPSVEYPTSTHK